MMPDALFIGLVISLAAFYLNRKVSIKNSAGLSHWNGWVAGMSLRFLGIIFSAFYLIILNASRKEAIHEFSFMLTVFMVVLSGLLTDLFLSITRIRKMKNRAGC